MFEDSSLCFINCHLAAGQTHTAHRNNDVATILEAEALPTERDPDIRASLYVGGVELTINVLIIHWIIGLRLAVLFRFLTGASVDEMMNAMRLEDVYSSLPRYENH